MQPDLVRVLEQTKPDHDKIFINRTQMENSRTLMGVNELNCFQEPAFGTAE